MVYIYRERDRDREKEKEGERNREGENDTDREKSPTSNGGLQCKVTPHWQQKSHYGLQAAASLRRESAQQITPGRLVIQTQRWVNTPLSEYPSMVGERNDKKRDLGHAFRGRSSKHSKTSEYRLRDAAGIAQQQLELLLGNSRAAVLLSISPTSIKLGENRCKRNSTHEPRGNPKSLATI